MKRICSLLLALVLLVVLFPTHAAAATLDDGLEYEVYEDHVAITDYTGDADEVVIPAEIEGLPVTVIADSAFYDCDMYTIKIPDSVTSIGAAAFYACIRLSNIRVSPDNPAYADLDGILYNKDLTSLLCCPGSRGGKYDPVILPDSVTSIGDYAFARTSIDTIALSDSVTTIGFQAFWGCYSLTSITIPDSVTSIGQGAFNQCWLLENVTIPNSITTIDDMTFYACSSLTSITIPASVSFLGEMAFSSCESLASIRFEGDVPRFDWGVFLGTTSTAYYPSDNPTWTEDVLRDYNGTITWIPYNPNNPFSDVPVGSFYEAPVLWALENGITTGATDTTFDPNGKCLRAHVVTFLYRAAENPEPAATKNPFTDVKTTDFFYKPVLWAVEKNITNGISADKFGSYDVCNRAAVVTFLWRSAGCPEPESTANPFGDVKPSDFFHKPVLWAVENGITNGLTSTEFGPNSPCNRAQVVTFLYRAYN